MVLVIVVYIYNTSKKVLWLELLPYDNMIYLAGVELSSQRLSPTAHSVPSRAERILLNGVTSLS